MPHSDSLTALPLTFTVGDTLAFTITAPAGHLASDSWTLGYSLQLPGSTATPITFNASASGDNYSVTVAASTTDDWTAGKYLWHSFLTKALTRYQHESGTITLLPNPAAAYGATHATRTLALIETAIEGRIPRGLESYSIQGQQIVKITISKLRELREYYAALVANEKAQAAIDSGLPNPLNHWARFTRVT